MRLRAGGVVLEWHAGVMVALRCEPFPADVDAAGRFYIEVLGFDVERDQRSAEAPYVALARGGVRSGLAQRADVGDVTQRRPPVGAELVLEVEDLDDAQPVHHPADARRRDLPSPGHHP